MKGITSDRLVSVGLNYRKWWGR